MIDVIPRFFRHPFARYCLVGAVGFAVDWCILQIVVHGIGLSPIYGRFVSYTVALFITWLLHRYFTFVTTNKASVGELVRYFLSNALGAGTNVGVYSLLVLLMPSLGLTLPLAIASIVALAVNYLGASIFVFAPRKH